MPEKAYVTLKERALVRSRIATKLRENSRGFWQDYHWFIVIFALALLCDAASTVHFLLQPDPDTEAHPAINFLCSNMLGPIAGPLLAAIAKLAIGIAIAVYCRRFAICIFVAVSAISLWAAWYNIWGFKLYTPIILEWIPW